MYYPMFQQLFNFPFRKEYDIKINLLTTICNKITQNLKKDNTNKIVIYVSTKRPYYLTAYNINEHLITFYQNINAYVTNIQETDNVIDDYITDDTHKILCFNVPSWMHRKKSGQQLFKVEVQVMPKAEHSIVTQP